MKKLFIVSAVLTFLLVSCTSSKKDGNVGEVDSLTPKNTEVVDMHNAENALDIVGIYKGTLPCADCEGIQTTVELNADNSYKVTTVYLTDRKGDKEFVEDGVWEIKVNTITLKNAAEDGQPNTQFFAGENTLTQLDLEGKKVEGPLAAHYVLKK